MKLLVFTTARSVRDFYEGAKCGSNALLDKAITAKDFFDIVVVGKKSKASAYESLLFMQKACAKTRDLERKLGIKSEFFAFLKNKDYIFSFFRELTLAQKSVQDLANKDFYALYDEHLLVLNELFENYKNEMKNANLYDEITLGEFFINGDFLSQFECVEFELGGFLNEFEMKILGETAAFTQINLLFKSSVFNVENLAKMPIFKDFKLDINFHYILNLNEKKLIKKDKILSKNERIKLKKFDIRSLQASFVFDEISQFIRAGVRAKDIAVITPDEDFCELLRLWDKDNMLNFASGISIKQSLLYQRLNALLYLSENNFSQTQTPQKNSQNVALNSQKNSQDLIKNSQKFSQKNPQDFKNNSQENYLKIDSLSIKEEYFKRASSLEFDKALFYGFDLNDFMPLNFTQSVDFMDFEALILSLSEQEDDEIKESVREELLFLKALLNGQKLTLKQLLELFFGAISKLKISDTRGGEATVMGLLESRGKNYEGVIIIDFNDEFIPKRSTTGLFINNEVRQKAGLISSNMSENLQRFYYESLIKGAKFVSIAYTQNEQSVQSRFLKELDIVCDEDGVSKKVSQKAYLKALAANYVAKKPDLTPLSPPVMKYDLFAERLSSTKLEKFLGQKRGFYYQFVLKIPTPRPLQSAYEPKDFGIFIHEALCEFYAKNEFFSLEKFMKIMQNYTLTKLDKSLVKLRFADFERVENESFRDGERILQREEWFEKPVKTDFGELLLCGKIDRIDEQNGVKIIYDYKTGKIPENSYQLAFYEALLGGKSESFFYDLRTMKKDKGKGTKSLDELLETLQELYLQRGGEIVFENECGKNGEERLDEYALIYAKSGLK